MIELAVFDMAGTTVYDGDAVSVCFRAALSGVGVFPELDAVNAVMGIHKPEAVRRLLSASGRTFSESEADAVHDDFVERMIRYYETDSAVREVPGAGRVFADLRRAGLKIALNTGFGRSIVDVILRRLDWTKEVDAVIASDEAPRGRPHPDMINLLMSQLDVNQPRRVAKVGDTPVDIEEGINAGCGLIVAVTTGGFRREQLEVYPQARVVGSVTDVPALLLP